MAFLLIFIVGWLSSTAYGLFNAQNSQKPAFLGLFGLSSAEEVKSPSDWVKESQIHVYNDKVVVDLTNARWSTFADTNSMLPFLDNGANGLEIVPQSAKDLNVGDIVAYKSDYADGIIVHRIIKTGYDEQGWYALIKGDSNPSDDPGKIRFNQIEGVLVGIIY